MRQARIALAGDEDVPKSSFDPSSLRLLSPRLALPFWLGYDAVPRKVVITNLFNHTQTSVALGWSVKRTQVRDFRGKRQTYDSHNGTDFCIARGTPVLAAASGHVMRVVSEFHRGGLKVAIDHGDGLITSSAHLARALVREGQAVKRGDVIAISGYSGLDSLVSFPWGIPHIHFNVWLDGQPIDPFARVDADEASLWIGGSMPINTDGGCLANGEPIGASGLRQVYENVLQLRGEAGAHQVPGNPCLGYTHVYGAPGISAVTILQR